MHVLREQTGLEGALTREHPSQRGQSRHLGRLGVDQHGSRLRAARATTSILPRTCSIRSSLENMRFKWRKWLVLRLQLESRAWRLLRDLPRLRATHPEFMHFGEFRRLGQSAGQAQQHRLRRAQRPWRRTKSKLRLGTGDDRASPPRRCRSTRWRRRNTNTTQTLVNAAMRLVDELPEGTPPDKVLEHWLASAAATMKRAA